MSTKLPQAVVGMKQMNRLTTALFQMLTSLHITTFLLLAHLLVVVQCLNQAEPLIFSKFRLDDLSDGPGILPFKLGPAKIVDHYHTFLEEIHIDSIKQQIDVSQNQLIDFTDRIPEKYFSKMEYQILFTSFINTNKNVLNKASQRLDEFKPIRAKRDLSSPLEIYSNDMNQEDVLEYEKNLKFLHENKLAGSLKKQFSYYKGITFQLNKIMNDTATNQKGLIENLINNVSVPDQERINNISHVLNIITENSQELLSEISILYNYVYSSHKHENSLPSLKDLINMKKVLKMLYKPAELLNLDVRYYRNVISIKSYVIETKIVIGVKIPIMNSMPYDLYSLYSVPNKKSLIIHPPYPYMVSDSQELLYMEDECPKIETWYICNRQLGFEIATHSDCIFNLIFHQNVVDCDVRSVSLLKEAFLKLDDYQYLLSLPNKTKVYISCSKESHQLSEGNYLATIPRNCSLRTSKFTIANTDGKILGKPVNITTLPNSTFMEVYSKNAPRFDYTSTDLSNLYNIQQSPEPRNLYNIPQQPVVQSAQMSHIIAIYVISSSALVLGLALFYLVHKQRRQIEITETRNRENTTY